MSLPLGAGVLLVWAASVMGGAPDLAPVPRPSLERIDPADQVRLAAARAELDALLDGAAAEPAEFASAFGSLGRLYLLHDLVAPAAAALDNARRLAPGDRRWAYYRGVLHQREGELAAAREAFEAARELDPADLATLIRLGRVRLEAMDLEAAEAAFREAVEVAPGAAAAHHGLGQVAYERGLWEEAIEHLGTALELQPGATSIHHLLGLAHRHLGDLERARAHLERNRHDPVAFDDPLMDELTLLLAGPGRHVKAGLRAATAGELELALAHYREAVRLAPEDPLARNNLALALVRTGAAREGIEHLETAVELDPEYRDARLNLAAALAEAGRWDEAVSHLRRAVAIDPAYHEARLALASALARSGRLEEAVEELTTTLEEAPGYRREVRARAHLQRGLLLEDSDAAAAEADLRRAAELAADPLEAHSVLARLLGRQGRYGEAAAAFQRALELAPEDVDLHFGRAMALLLDGEDAAAREALESGVDRLPESLPLRHLLARVLAASADPDVRRPRRALELAQEVFRAEPSLLHAETLAMAYAATGSFAEAIVWQRRVVEETERRQGPRAAERPRRRLAAYQRGEAAVAPWSDG